MKRHPDFTEELRQLQSAKSNQGLWVIAFCFVGLATLLALPLFLRSFQYYFLAWPLIGLMQYQVVIAGHEAVHRTFCVSSRVNEAMGALTQALVGVNFTAYRIQHMDHHTATSRALDPDQYIYHNVVSARKGTVRFLAWTLGTFHELAMKIYQKGAGGVGNLRDHSPQVRQMKKRHTFYVLLAQGLIFLWCWYATKSIFGYFLLWFGPLIAIAVFLNRTRILVEHGLAFLLNEKQPFALPNRLPTVDVHTNFVDRLVFAPFNFSYHASHHLFPSVPYSNLPRLSELCDKYQIEGHHALRRSYLRCVATILQH